MWLLIGNFIVYHLIHPSSLHLSIIIPSTIYHHRFIYLSIIFSSIYHHRFIYYLSIYLSIYVGFKDQIYDVFKFMPEMVQCTIFSATMPMEVIGTDCIRITLMIRLFNWYKALSISDSIYRLSPLSFIILYSYDHLSNCLSIYISSSGAGSDTEIHARSRDDLGEEGWANPWR